MNESNIQLLREMIEKARQDFRFKYVGGGYFRDKNVQIGDKAEVKHAKEIIDESCEELMKTVKR